MTKAKYDIAPQYLRAEETRQRYLDFFNAHPGSWAVDLAEHMATTYDDNRSTCNTTRKMLQLGELRAVVTGRSWVYFATTTKTTSARELSYIQRGAASRHMCKLRGIEEKKTFDKPVEKVSKPGHYVHKPTYTHNSGGQGCVRERVWPGTSMGMI